MLAPSVQSLIKLRRSRHSNDNTVHLAYREYISREKSPILSYQTAAIQSQIFSNTELSSDSGQFQMFTDPSTDHLESDP